MPQLSGNEPILGLNNFFSKIASPLFVLLMKNDEFKWTNPCQEAFNTLKHQLSTTPILRGPDSTLPFHISSDASDTAIGAILGLLSHISRDN
jgi:hypothetical protein